MNTRTYDVRKGQLSLGDCGSKLNKCKVRRKPPVDVTYAQEARQLGLRLWKHILLYGFEVLLVRTQTSCSHYMAKVLHLVTKEVALLRIEGDPLLPE